MYITRRLPALTTRSPGAMPVTLPPSARTWVWAMPERAQLLGLMVYRVVDDITWVEVARDMPELVPRGLPGHRRYF